MESSDSVNQSFLEKKTAQDYICLWVEHIRDARLHFLHNFEF